MSCFEGLVVKAHFSYRKLGLESAQQNKKLTGADYIKPNELLVNIRAANLDYSLLALSAVFSFASAAAVDFGFAVACAVFFRRLAGTLSASPGASGLYTINTRPWRKLFVFNPFQRLSRSGGTPKSSATVSTVSPVCVL